MYTVQSLGYGRSDNYVRRRGSRAKGKRSKYGESAVREEYMEEVLEGKGSLV